MELTREFKDISKHDANIAGGKGASLGEMTQAGIPVPPGYVLLSNAFERFIEETDLNVEIDTILHKVDHKEIHTVDKASEDINSLILNAQMPADIEKEIKSHFKKLGATFVAVRSSATAEDSASAAWAGQLDTFLNTTEETLIEKVKHCWASLFTPRAIFYRFEKELHKTKISVAVVIQKMVDSEISGIAFSVHPVTEDYNQLIIEGGLGLGEAIVSGQITPDSYVVEKEPRRIIDVNVSGQERGLFKKMGGGSEWRDISAIEGEKQKLSESQILELSEIILGIEKHYGFPCDIEWAFAEGKFYITQSRPITTLKNISARPVISKTDSVSEGEVWSNNFLADVCTYQLTSGMMKFWPYGQRAILGKNAPLILTKCFLNYVGTNFEGGYLLDKELTEFSRVLTKIAYEEPQKILKNHKESYKLNKKYFDYSSKLLETNLSLITNKQLAKKYCDLTIAQETAHSHSLGTTWFIDSHGATFTNSLINKTKAIVESSGLKLNHAEVFSILTTPPKNSLAFEEEVESLSIILKIQNDPNVKKIFANLKNYDQMPASLPTRLSSVMKKHLEKWCWVPFGYRGPAYSMDYYLSVWSGLVREGVDAQALIKEKKARPAEIKKERIALFKKLKISPSMQVVCDIAADIAFLKGYRKDCSYLGFYAVDFLFQEISKRTGIKLADLHLLHYWETAQILNGEISFDKGEIDLRKIRSFQYWDEVTDEVTTVSGEKAVEHYNTKKIKREEIVVGTDTFKGTCACNGYAKGVVKIINQPDEMSKMEQGNIMVSHTTFPSLVPAMKKAGAIVTEDGGITCHAAIVARELKTPCVTGIKIATKVLKDGDTVEVDADKGVVRLLKRA